MQSQYHALILKTLKGEAKSYLREQMRRAQWEINFTEMSDWERNRLSSMDEYDSDHHQFETCGYTVPVHDDLLAIALKTLPEGKRNIVLLSYFLNMSDEEISSLFHVARSTVFRRRKAALDEIKSYLSRHANGYFP